MERRRFARLDIELNVRWKRIHDKSKDSSLNIDKIKNISRGGLCLVTSKKLEIGIDLRIGSRLPKAGDYLFLGIELPSKKVIETKGKVVWVREMGLDNLEGEEEYNVGVEFIEMKEEDREEIYRLVLESLTR